MIKWQNYFIIFFFALVFMYPARAAEIPVVGSDTSKQEILQLRDVVTEKKQKLSELNQKIDEYKKKIRDKQHEVISYTNQIALIENRVARATLDIEAKNLEIEQVGAEIQVLEEEIRNRENDIVRGRTVLAELLREIRRSDRQSDLDIIVSNKTFSQFFVQAKQLEDMRSQLQKTLEIVRAVKVEREAERADREGKITMLQRLKNEIEEKKEKLHDEQGTKTYLLAQAEKSETKFQSLLRDLRQESQLIDAELGDLEERITDRLKSLDLTLGAGAVLSWPLVGSPFITTQFNDPEYPFRYLFEHSGLDLRAAVGTPIGAAAPGIVAVARRGKLYGNYVIIIHGNKLATVYAHLSQILVEPDQVVKRGETIGFSGGRSGDPGAGLSSGPHLHFEVRAHGIPVDPLGYVVSL